MKHKKILIPAVCLCLAVPAAIWAFGTSKNGGDNGNKIKQIFTSKSISSKSHNLTSKLNAQNVSSNYADISFDDEFKQADYTFTLDLLKNECSETENVLISPYSVIQSFGMLANGADGDTLKEIEDSMCGLPADKLNNYLCKWRTSQSDEESKLTTANSLWIKDDEELIHPKQEFLQTSVDYYAPDIFTTPFDKHTLKDINAWINQNVEGSVTDHLDEIDPDAVMYIVNADEFDAKWQVEYLNSEIHDGFFTNYNGDKQSAEMMCSNESYIIEDDHAIGFFKRYRGGKYAFAAILPDEDMTVCEYIDSLTPEHFGELMAVSKNEAKDWDSQFMVVMPKFKYDYKTDLGETLKEMGIKKVFGMGEADFSKLSDADQQPYLSRVIHDTYIQFDEKGTKAAAASLHEEDVSAALPSCKNEMYFVRPFVYAIVDTETDLPIFMGTLMSIPE